MKISFACLATSTFQNTIIHADFTHHHILFNKHNKSISGVIDFGDAQIGDPAFDFAGLYYDFGDEFTTSVYEQYSTLISHHDPLLIHRITTFYQYSPYYIILFITLSQRMNSNSLQAQNS